MKAPAFWSHGQTSCYAKLLAPLSCLYNQITTSRANRLADFKADIPVICIGNLTMGGAGKTPTAIALCKMLRRLGKNPAFLSRGYGGSLTGPVFVTTAHKAVEVGDEPLLLRQHAPVCVSQNRIDGAKALVAHGADIIIMDDGFQNPHLHKDLSLIVIDGGFGHGNERVFPAGPLRESLQNGLGRTDLAILIGDDATGTTERLHQIKPDLPILKAHIRAEENPVLRERPCLAFAGIGRPEKFFDTLNQQGLNLVGTEAFSDHHLFHANEINSLKEKAKNSGATLVTTEKDFVRLPPALQDGIETLKITLDFEQADMLNEHLKQY
ncbi:tetraacyldisaccharide 4'-kinase [Terasakiella pusilla]|uniref:tetraacyldisaccharide 4'-kinase n=1 Tax=Terasakiella pusilla TaxID=64973 RepID=UPI00049056BF|nr:tetraacyldisaccharide 4'-kinase [Terasakiella pusilla]